MARNYVFPGSNAVSLKPLTRYTPLVPDPDKAPGANKYTEKKPHKEIKPK